MLADRAAEMAERFAPSPPFATDHRWPAAGRGPVTASGGRIHATWLVGSRVVQRVNTSVFADPTGLAAQVARICGHLHLVLAGAGCDPAERPRRALTPLAAREGGWTAADGQGGVWRAFVRIPGAVAAAGATAAEAAAAGGALGRLLVDLADLPGPPLVEAIPGFKDFGARRHAFEAAAAADPLGRAARARYEIERVRRGHGLVDELEAHRGSGRLPLRATHNDAKAANVLLDAASGEALCVVDLDTAGPGSPLFDAGDLLRSTAVAPEGDGTAAGSGRVRKNVVEAALGAWLAGAGPCVGPDERALLPLAGPLMAYENALRFLTDHLLGDPYFGAEHPDGNLERARAQLAVLDALEEARPLVAQVVDRR